MKFIIPNATLQNGQKIPLIGLGTYKFKLAPENTGDIVKAFEMGYRHLDTAYFYKNEKYCGQEINNFLKNNQQNVKREDLFITTKLDTLRNRPDLCLQAAKDQISELNLDYIDLYLIHAPWSTDAEGNMVDYDMVELWHQLEKLVDLGLVKSLGVSNFNAKQCELLVKNCKKYQPQVNQVESHIWFHNNQLISDMQKLNIHVSAYLVVGRNDRISNHHKNKKGMKLLEEPLLLELTEKYASNILSPSDLCIKFTVQRGLSAIVKAQSAQNQAKNLNIFEEKFVDLKIDEADMERLFALPQVRGIVYEANKDHIHYPGYTIES